ncbi:hypothetical protein SAMD00019534_005780 [Acytostelium subglobosum LB1]|uniref:hypothetical protein n=1 Tax=Acytostelium subglobosum LB1 TaxID=1410327 RepID=UPI0006448E9B|nr:hypothetical protein SAMD00019534_005780 [Acytostelium subglobosum LB1]GAM17403.1 hypothetical protein SAMD00019534_005780 [Acytostelium subglobosum LB1]|eukprot:XP_012759465.1 hypothetical protein SAMD00019534_005780 [Acytostelium subglobosum LB1]
MTDTAHQISLRHNHQADEESTLESSNSNNNESNKDKQQQHQHQQQHHHHDNDDQHGTKWLTTEFIIYYVIIIIGYLICINKILNSSRDYNDGLKNSAGIVPGWFIGRKQDLSDSQYRTWRGNFPLLSIGLSIFIALSTIIRKYGGSSINNINSRLLYYIIASLLFLLFVHGSSTIIIVAIALSNFGISRFFARSSLLPLVTWAFNGFILWTSYIYSGYQFSSLAILGSYGPLLDSYHGSLAWETYFKMSMLRFISYNMDYYWMMMKRPVVDTKDKDDYFVLQETHLAHEHQYDITHYLAYIFYIPLYIAGPIITFNAFVGQVYAPQRTYTLAQLVKMSINIVLIFFAVEIGLHYSYYYSFDRSDVWMSLGGDEIALMGYMVLNFMYLKFLIIWRVFRLFALYDGINTPENMNRCVNNNYTFTGFWRSWHASFNKWTLRYLYIPLGGNRTRHITVWIIFFFIGLWHDLWWSWVAWALLNCVFFTAEIGVMTYFYSPKRLPLRRTWYWRYVVAVAGTFNIYLLMIANLAILHGFANSILFIKLCFFGEGGLRTFIFSYVWLFSGISLMIEQREHESRAKAN